VPRQGEQAIDAADHAGARKADASTDVRFSIVVASFGQLLLGSTHLKSFGYGTVIGEMGFFREGRRSADVTAETAATLYSLTRQSFDRLQF
jgi:CRP-like cAMP-binding protein